MGLLGSNGAGKSTLMTILSGALQPSAGVALLAGVDIARSRARLQLRGVCPQQDTLWPELTVRETVAFYAALKLPSAGSTAASEVASPVGLLTPLQESCLEQVGLRQQADQLVSQLRCRCARKRFD